MPDRKQDSNLNDSAENGLNAAKPGGFHPVVKMLIGMALALAVFIALYFIDFALIHLIWSVPALALSALLIFSGSRKLRQK